MQVEVFFIYHNGEQRGPYTAKQINHLYQCGFIDDDSLYWREGLEQWQPVPQIVLRRRKRNRLLVWSIILGVLAAIAFFVALFGPVTANAWRELTSGDFTGESAWWRSRGLVREHVAKDGTIEFDPFPDAKVTMHGRDGATVILGGTILHPGGDREHAEWRVLLRFDADRGMWTPSRNQDKSPPQS